MNKLMRRIGSRVRAAIQGQDDDTLGTLSVEVAVILLLYSALACLSITALARPERAE